MVWAGGNSGGARAKGTLMLARLRKLLEYQLSIAELLGLGILLGTPYLIVGVIWSSTHTAHLHDMHGVDLVVSFLGSIVSWPVLLFANVCMT
ncbi:hypothetical protein I550_5825 [Mycobacterium intracellulare 1956]|uniref:Uncharacterized protein n=3 Tax=Mycobacterium avium complex (MAC) TaxID=120793 RepID=X8CDK4_MYCIT|nr:hypothetical protein I550_5825 [Mycobacterium intracellulare 1956]